MSSVNRGDHSDLPASDLSFVLRDAPDKEARAVITEQLDQYNVDYTGVADNTALDVLIFDDATKEVIGGLVGRTSLGVLFVDYFFVPDSLRGKGHGGRALAMAEAEAVRRGCSKAVLFTMAIQAPSFYEKHGYETFGRVDCDPPGNARIFMKKDLRP
jgi:GNAT superfamily N-acetyltransferase